MRGGRASTDQIASSDATIRADTAIRTPRLSLASKYGWPRSARLSPSSVLGLPEAAPCSPGFKLGARRAVTCGNPDPIHPLSAVRSAYGVGLIRCLIAVAVVALVGSGSNCLSELIEDRRDT